MARNSFFKHKLVIVFLLLVGLALSVILFTDNGGEERLDSWQTDYARTSAAKSYGLSDARQSSHLNITVYSGEGRQKYLGWSGDSDELASFTEAVAGAVPAEGSPDESFTDLMIFYFDDGGSLELTYSRERGMMMLDDQLYRPASDITPLIDAGLKRYE